MDLDEQLEAMKDEKKPSHDNRENSIAYIAIPIDVQDAQVIHHRPNFFVLAPSSKTRPSRVALKEIEDDDDTVESPAIRLKHMARRNLFEKRPSRVALKEIEDDDDTVESPAIRLKHMARRNLFVLTNRVTDGINRALETFNEETNDYISDLIKKEKIEIEVKNVAVRDEATEEAVVVKVAGRTVLDKSVAVNMVESPAGQELIKSQGMPIPVASGEVRPGIIARINSWKLPNWLETILVIGILAGSFVAHAVNMFNYPHYEQDEGTYLMYAWAVTRGMISPYAYGYGHPPLAWMQIAGWVELTGGFHAFGNAINSGRVLMLLLAVISTLLVYLIARHLGANFVVCLLGVVFFAFSPLSITFQREVLLDNFAAFWFLVSLYLIVMGKSHLFSIIGAAISFGFSLLSKEVVIILFPIMVYVVWLYTTRFQRKFTLMSFTYIVIAIGSSFVLMAVLKGELFPYSWHLPWDHHPHLSLIDTYTTQVGRGQQQGSIKASWAAWVQGDPLLILVGFVAPAFNFLTGWWNRKGLFLAFFAALYWLLLLRGGVVFAFYIIPLIPIIALNLVFALTTLTRWITKLVRFNFIGIALVTCTLVALIPYGIQHDSNPYNVFTLRPAIVQNEAVVWINEHVPRRAVLAISSNLYVDLHDPGGEGVGDGAPYPYAHVYWFIGLDPALHDTLLRGNWDRIDYLVLDSEMLNDIQTYGGGMQILHDALDHSVLRIEFKGDNNEFIRIYQVLHKQPPPQA